MALGIGMQLLPKTGPSVSDVTKYASNAVAGSMNRIGKADYTIDLSGTPPGYTRDTSGKLVPTPGTSGSPGIYNQNLSAGSWGEGGSGDYFKKLADDQRARDEAARQAAEAEKLRQQEAQRLAEQKRQQDLAKAQAGKIQGRTWEEVNPGVNYYSTTKEAYDARKAFEQSASSQPYGYGSTTTNNITGPDYIIGVSNVPLWERQAKGIGSGMFGVRIGEVVPTATTTKSGGQLWDEAIASASETGKAPGVYSSKETFTNPFAGTLLGKYVKSPEQKEQTKQAAEIALAVPGQYLGTIFSKQLTPELTQRAVKGNVLQRFGTFLDPTFQYDVAKYNYQYKKDILAQREITKKVDVAKTELLGTGIPQTELESGTITSSLTPTQEAALSKYNLIVGEALEEPSTKRLSEPSSTLFQDLAKTSFSEKKKGILSATLRTAQTVPYFFPATRAILGLDVVQEGYSAFETAETKGQRALAGGQIALGGVLAYSGIKGIGASPEGLTLKASAGKLKALKIGMYAGGTALGAGVGVMDYYSTLKATGSKSVALGAAIGSGGTIIAGLFAPAAYQKAADYLRTRKLIELKTPGISDKPFIRETRGGVKQAVFYERAGKVKWYNPKTWKYTGTKPGQFYQRQYRLIDPAVEANLQGMKKATFYAIEDGQVVLKGGKKLTVFDLSSKEYAQLNLYRQFKAKGSADFGTSLHDYPHLAKVSKNVQNLVDIYPEYHKYWISKYGSLTGAKRELSKAAYIHDLLRGIKTKGGHAEEFYTLFKQGNLPKEIGKVSPEIARAIKLHEGDLKYIKTPEAKFLKTADIMDLSRYGNIKIKSELMPLSDALSRTRTGKLSGQYYDFDIKIGEEQSKILSQLAKRTKDVMIKTGEPTTKFPFDKPATHAEWFAGGKGGVQQYYIPKKFIPPEITKGSEGFGYSAAPGKWIEGNELLNQYQVYYSGKGASVYFFREGAGESGSIQIGGAQVKGKPILYGGYFENVKVNPGKEIQVPNPLEQGGKAWKQYVLSRNYPAGTLNLPLAKLEVEGVVTGGRVQLGSNYFFKFSGRKIPIDTGAYFTQGTISKLNIPSSQVTISKSSYIPTTSYAPNLLSITSYGLASSSVSRLKSSGVSSSLVSYPLRSLGVSLSGSKSVSSSLLKYSQPSQVSSVSGYGYTPAKYSPYSKATSITTRKTPPGKPFGIAIPRIRFKEKSKSTPQILNQPTRYQPSFTASVLNLRSKTKPLLGGSFQIRTIIDDYKKKKKKFIFDRII